eukprot:superscaffoldBa00002432_g14223
MLFSSDGLLRIDTHCTHSQLEAAQLHLWSSWLLFASLHSNGSGRIRQSRGWAELRRRRGLLCFLGGKSDEVVMVKLSGRDVKCLQEHEGTPRLSACYNTAD